MQLSHTYKRPSSVCLSRHVSYSSSKGEKKEKSFSSVSFSSSLSVSLSVSLVECFSSRLTFIQSSVMPSWCVYSVLFQSLLITLIISFKQTLSTNDSQHQILKADVGQDVTMSCLFDEDKIEQVRTKIEEKKNLFCFFIVQRKSFVYIRK